ncbi:MAG: helix-turn-helix transcriptional regulator [Rhizobiaceae bacterium]
MKRAAATKMPPGNQDAEAANGPAAGAQGGAAVAPHRTEPPHGSALPDAVRRCRWIALDLNATGFAVFMAGPSPDRPFLTPCFDHAYPGVSPQTRALTGDDRNGFVEHARQSTMPLRWSDVREPAPGFAALDWCQDIQPPLPGTCGIAVPVHGASHRVGLVVFFGPSIELTRDMFLDIHVRCFATFDLLVKARPEAGRKLAAISKRELECLRLTANGYTSAEIARMLNLSVHTTNQYLASATLKLDAVNRSHAVAKALRLELID